MKLPVIKIISNTKRYTISNKSDAVSDMNRSYSRNKLLSCFINFTHRNNFAHRNNKCLEIVYLRTINIYVFKSCFNQKLAYTTVNIFYDKLIFFLSFVFFKIKKAFFTLSITFHLIILKNEIFENIKVYVIVHDLLYLPFIYIKELTLGQKTSN